MFFSQVITTSTDDPSLLADDQAILKMLGHQYQWLAAAGGYDLEIGPF